MPTDPLVCIYYGMTMDGLLSDIVSIANDIKTTRPGNVRETMWSLLDLYVYELEDAMNKARACNLNPDTATDNDNGLSAAENMDRMLGAVESQNIQGILNYAANINTAIFRQASSAIQGNTSTGAEM